MVSTILVLCVFGWVFSFCYAIYLYRTRSKISEKLAVNDDKVVVHQPFLDVIWEYSLNGINLETALRYAVISTFFGFLIGIFLSIQMALIGAISFFILGPRIFLQYKKRKVKEKFYVQFPRAIASFNAAARVMPLAKCFEQVSSEMPTPSKEVFGYITNAINLTNLGIAQAVHNAADQFELPELNSFAEALQLLDEIGGGEEATLLLEAVAEETRFKRRHEMEVKGIFGELQATMIASTVIPILLLLYFVSDPNGIHAQIIKKSPLIVVSGLVVLTTGWLISRMMIKNASKTL